MSARKSPNPNILFASDACRYLGISRSTLVRYQNRADDPIPFRYICGHVVIFKDQLDAWMRRQPMGNAATETANTQPTPLVRKTA